MRAASGSRAPIGTRINAPNPKAAAAYWIFIIVPSGACMTVYFESNKSVA